MTFGFDWWPGGLAWLLVLELVTLGVIAAFRTLAQMLGRDNPRDFFVVFYRVFWSAFARPNLHPIPLNYQPTRPKQDVPPEAFGDGSGLSDDEIDSLMTEDRHDDAAATSAGDDAYGSKVPELLVRVESPRETTSVLSIDALRSIVTLGVTTAPDDGRANAAAVTEVSRLLGVGRHQVRLAAGQTKADKTLAVTGLTADGISDRLATAAAASLGDEASVGFRDE